MKFWKNSMIKIFSLLLILGQIIMAANIEHIKVNDINVPIIYEKDTRLPIVSMKFVFTDSGSTSDKELAGVAKFSAKMLGEGTKSLGSDAFAQALEAKAIHISAAAGAETFNIELDTLKENLNEGLKYFDSLIKEPNLTTKALDKVKTTTIGALNSKKDDFDYVASNKLKSLLFSGTVLENPSSGTIQSVEKISLNNVKDFVKKHIVSSRVIVVVGGDIDIKDIKKRVAKILKAMPEGKSSKVKNFIASDKMKEAIVKEDTQQAYIYFGSPFDMKSNSKDYYKARVATFILGAGGFGSRLMEEIRVKRGLAYSAYARVHVSKSSSYLNGYLQTKIDSQDEAVKTVKEVIAKFVKDGVSKEELEQTKMFLLGSEPLRVETMSQKLNRTFMEYYKGQELGYAKKELELIKNLKLEDLNEFIKDHKEILKLSFAIVTK